MERLVINPHTGQPEFVAEGAVMCERPQSQNIRETLRQMGWTGEAKSEEIASSGFVQPPPKAVTFAQVPEIVRKRCDNCAKFLKDPKYELCYTCFLTQNKKQKDARATAMRVLGTVIQTCKKCGKQQAKVATERVFQHCWDCKNALGL